MDGGQTLDQHGHQLILRLDLGVVQQAHLKSQSVVRGHDRVVPPHPDYVLPQPGVGLLAPALRKKGANIAEGLQATQRSLSHRPRFHGKSRSDLKRCLAGGSPKASVIAPTIADRRIGEVAL